MHFKKKSLNHALYFMSIKQQQNLPHKMFLFPFFVSSFFKTYSCSEEIRLTQHYEYGLYLCS